MVNYLREFQSAAGVPRDKLYDSTMYVLCAMLIAGLICNWLIKPVNRKWRMSEAEVARLQAASAKSEATIQHGSFGIDKGGLDLKAALFWLFVGIPLGWGVYNGCWEHPLQDSGKRGKNLLIARLSPRDAQSRGNGLIEQSENDS